ncbi:MAG: hypothetical protein IPL53_21480 [Ignavibacteria bacterium]|nr:hypothetical protein [Ignavibacteria bacterium]
MAFLTLQTAAADSIAKSLGYKTSASETKRCIKCHVLGRILIRVSFSQLLK